MPERNIDSAMWEDPKILRLSPHARALLQYLITSSRGHAMGIFRLPLYVIDREHGFPREEYIPAMAELSRASMAHYDTEREIVWVVNMAKRQARSPQVWRGLRKHLRSLFETPLIAAFVEHYEGTRFDTKRGEERPVTTAMATLAEPLPKGCATLGEWLEQGYRTLATLPEGYSNPSGTGTGTGVLEKPVTLAPEHTPARDQTRARAHSERPPGRKVEHLPAPAEHDAEYSRRAEALWLEAASERSSLSALGYGSSGDAPGGGLGADRRQFERTGLWEAVQVYTDEQLRHAIAVRVAECKAKRTLRYLNPAQLWGKSLAWAVGASLGDVKAAPAAKPEGERRYYQHTGDEEYAGGEVKI